MSFLYLAFPRRAVALGALLTLACADGEAASEPGDELAARRGDVVVRTLLSGELVAAEAVALAAPNIGIWPLQIRWLAANGEPVRAGEPVIEFDNSQLVSRLEELRLRVTEAVNRLDSLEASTAVEIAEAAMALEEATGQLEKARLKTEVPAELVAAAQREKDLLELRRAELELEGARERHESVRRAKRAEIAIQRLALEQAATELARAEENLERAVLRAPRDGIVILEENNQEGRPFRAGDTAFPGSVLARLPDLSTLYVEGRLFDVDDGRIVAGAPVTATLDAFPDQPLRGRVRQIDAAAREPDRFSSRRFFRTHVDLELVDPERMRPGMSVKVVVDEPYEDVLTVPRRSLRWRETGAEARLARGDWRAVELGPCDAVVCVLESGLEEGTELAVAEPSTEARS